MSTLVIKNFGPIRSANIETKRFNIYIGPQGSGKSCLMKVLSFCQWLEKRIELTQDPAAFGTLDFVEKQLIQFHKLGGYIKDDSFIQYESRCMKFAFDFGKTAFDMFSFEWKEDRWEYTRGSITYIPAERNISFVIPNWFEMKFYEDNLQNYLADWDEARRLFDKENPLHILDLNVKYYYDPSRNADWLVLEDDSEIKMGNAASGFQSVTPLLALVWSRTMSMLSGQSRKDLKSKWEQNQLEEKVRNLVLSYVKGKTPPITMVETKDKEKPEYTSFPSHEAFNEFERILSRYEYNHHASLLIEEPEENLFPKTQYELVKWLARQVGTNNSLFLTTHSPYILSAFNNLIYAYKLGVKRPDDVGRIVTQDMWIPTEDVASYMIKEEGGVMDIIDVELGEIRAEMVDEASGIINRQYNALMMLDTDE